MRRFGSPIFSPWTSKKPDSNGTLVVIRISESTSDIESIIGG